MTTAPKTRSANSPQEWNGSHCRRTLVPGTEYSLSWKVNATRPGRCFLQLALSVHRTAGTGGKRRSFWPTPTAQSSDCCGGSNTRKAAKRRGTYVGKGVNPEFQEWVMGFTPGWTDLGDATSGQEAIDEGRG